MIVKIQNGIFALVDIVAAFLLAFYVSGLGQWVWLLVALLLWQGFVNLIKLFT